MNNNRFINFVPELEKGFNEKTPIEKLQNILIYSNINSFRKFYFN